MTPPEEEAYEQGSRAAWFNVLRTALRHLGDGAPDAARLIAEREEAVLALRAHAPEMDLPDDLHLADAIRRILKLQTE